jgi:hypothetical protein
MRYDVSGSCHGACEEKIEQQGIQPLAPAMRAWREQCKIPDFWGQFMQFSLRWYGRHVTCLLLLVYAGTGCLNARGGDDSAPNANGYELNRRNRSVVHSIESEIAAPQNKKFVEVEITEVMNPQRIPLSFTVHYQSPQGEQSFLGIFSLFPPDNPGRFIIATQGKLQTDGKIIVTFMPLEELQDHHAIRVRVNRISLIGD